MRVRECECGLGPRQNWGHDGSNFNFVNLIARRARGVYPALPTAAAHALYCSRSDSFENFNAEGFKTFLSTRIASEPIRVKTIQEHRPLIESLYQCLDILFGLSSLITKLYLRALGD